MVITGIQVKMKPLIRITAKGGAGRNIHCLITCPECIIDLVVERDYEGPAFSIECPGCRAHLEPKKVEA